MSVSVHEQSVSPSVLEANQRHAFELARFRIGKVEQIKAVLQGDDSNKKRDYLAKLEHYRSIHEREGYFKSVMDVTSETGYAPKMINRKYPCGDKEVTEKKLVFVRPDESGNDDLLTVNRKPLEVDATLYHTGVRIKDWRYYNQPGVEFVMVPVVNDFGDLVDAVIFKRPVSIPGVPDVVLQPDQVAKLNGNGHINGKVAKA